MVRSRFERYGESFRAVRTFTDREEPQEVFRRCVLEPVHGQPKVLSYYGVGGVGKTRLCNELRSSVGAFGIEGVDVPLLDLSFREHRTPAEALLYIRRAVDAPCPTFELAYARLWGLLGRPMDDLEGKLAGARSGLIADILDYGRGAGADLLRGGTFIPGGEILVKVGVALRSRWMRWTHERKRLLEEMDLLPPGELQDRLPYYLGVDLAQTIESGRKCILFVDSLESLWLGEDGVFGAHDHTADQWLRDLIAPAHGCVAVIFSRTKLDWNAIAGEGWGSAFEEHLLGVLASEDCERFLRGVPIPERELTEHITKISQGLPLILDLSVDIYEAKRRDGEVPTKDDFGFTSHQVLESSLRHMSLAERETARVVSVPREFDADLFRYLVRKLGTTYPETAFKVFCDHSFVVTSSGESNKIHDVMRHHMLSVMDGKTKRACRRAVFNYYRSALEDGRVPALYAWLQVLSVAVSSDADTLRWLGEVFSVDLREGNWIEVRQGLREWMGLRLGKVLPQSLRVPWGVTERWLGNAGAARDTFESVDWASLPQFICEHGHLEYGNTLRLTGDHLDALALYRSLAEDRANSDEVRCRATLQHADMLTVHGRFTESVDVIQGVTDEDRRDHLGIYARRLLAHNYRFNLMWPEARELYLECLHEAREQGLLGLVGKLLTNLLENKVYELRGRDEKIEEDALRVNGDLGNNIELGKALAARGVLRVLVNGDVKMGLEDLLRSKELRKKTGYVGGEIVGLSYDAIIRLACGDARGAKRRLNSLRELSQTSVAYPFLLDQFSILGCYDLGGAGESFSWIDHGSWLRGWQEVRDRLDWLSRRPRNDI